MVDNSPDKNQDNWEPLKQVTLRAIDDARTTAALLSMVGDTRTLVLKCLTPDERVHRAVADSLATVLAPGHLHESVLSRFRKGQKHFALTSLIGPDTVECARGLRLVSYGVDNYFFLFESPNLVDLAQIDARLAMDSSVRWGQEWVDWVKESIGLLGCVAMAIPDDDCTVIQIVTSVPGIVNTFGPM